MSSKFLRLEACPKCREQGSDKHGDNLAVYSDGSYCFSCGYTRRNVLQGFFEFSETGKGFPRSSNSNDGKRPIQVEGHGPTDEAREWLEGLDLTDKERYGILRIHWDSHYFGWKFPVNKQFYQVRLFGPKRKSKWITHGQKPLMHLYNQTKGTVLDTVVLVEDIISAVKISRVVTASPLFGSNWKWTPEILQKLTPFKHIIIWLDWDKKDYAFRQMKKLQQYGFKVSMISTESDPKEQTTEYVQELLDTLT
jgi:hypothetical protein